jgi:ParB/RepB/Spo0J family partition protein
MATETKINPNQIYDVDPQKIWADFKWNSRSPDFEGVEDLETETKTFEALVESIRVNGQKEAVVLMPLTGEQKADKKCPAGAEYFLVAGFRRLAAVTKIGGRPVRAIIELLDPAQARVRNLAENTARDNLSGADLAWGCYQLTQQGMQDKDIAAAIGKSQPYVSKLTKIMGSLPKELRKAWRDARQPIPVMSLYEMVTSIAPEKYGEAFEALTQARNDNNPEKHTRNPNKWYDKMKEEIKIFGYRLGLLVNDEQMPEFDMKSYALNVVELCFELPARCSSQQRRGLVTVLKSSYKEGKEAEIQEEEGEEEETDDEDTEPSDSKKKTGT